MLDFIAEPLGQFLYFIYNTLAFHNYGLAIIFFTIIIKMVLLPLTIKQTRSTSKMNLIQPQIKEIQTRYKNDKQKLNQELMKVYQQEKVNPAGGCLPLLVQMPILISLYWTISGPLKFMFKVPVDTINKLVEALNITERFQQELAVVNNFDVDKVKSLLSVDVIDKIVDLGRGLNFLGLKLGYTATIETEKLFGAESHIYLPLLLLPIVGVITTFISSKLTMPQQNTNKAKNASGGSMQNTMMYIGPIMTLIFSFQLPAGVILYWIAGYVFQIFQQLYINKHIKKEGGK